MQSFHERLKEATRSQHQTTEKLLFPHQSWDTFSLDDYQQFLKIQYVFHVYMERSIDNTLSPKLKDQLDWLQRRKLSSIQDDLHELSSATSVIIDHTQPLTSEAEALGYLYVTEGSTLGGRMISKALQKNEQIAACCSFRFLNVYGTDTGRYWKSFLKVLSEEISTNQEKTVIAAAQRAFNIFTQSVYLVRGKALA